MKGPDFLCIGMAKAGTAWLYDQTQFHPDFWMPPLKEVAYLTRAANLAERAQALLTRAEQKARGKVRPQLRRRNINEQYLGFLRDASRLPSDQLDLSSYADLFRHKGSLLSGDITPSYSGLDEGAIHALATALPHLRVLLLVREPIERLWSHASMLVRKGRAEPEIFSQPQSLYRFLESSPMAGFVSFPTQVAQRWGNCAPSLALKVVLFDQIVSHPEETRCEIFEHFGAQKGHGKCTVAPDHNRKSGTAKLEMTEEVRAVLLSRYAEEIRACAAMFGGVSKTWPERYGLG